MKRAALLCILLAAVACLAQQPDVRLNLLSRYQLRQITIAPATNTRLSWGAEKSTHPLQSALAVSVAGNRIEAGGRSGLLLVVQGSFQLVADGRTQSLHVPVEISARQGCLLLIARMPVEEYVASVLQGESAGQLPGEALKALAVAIRSYATHFRERHKSEGFDFCDTTHCQYARPVVSSSVRAAVAATSGELLWDRGNPLAAYYHQDCGGRTEAAAVVWPDQRSQALISHRDSYCLRANSPWRAEMTPMDLDRSLRSSGLTVPRGWDRIAISERTPSGRARTLRFSIGSGPGIAVSASSVRFAVGRSLGWAALKSDFYEVSKAGGKFVFVGRGVGHGVGLCQTGAAEMARQGRLYRDILAYYYPGAAVGRSAQAIPWKTVSGASFDVRAVNPSDVAVVQTAARSASAWAERQTGLPMLVHPTLEVFPSVAMFRNATGEPGWVAASTRRDRVRIQPLGVLGSRLENVLRHEFLHILVETHARTDTPLWFREGLAVFLSGEVPARVTTSLSADHLEAIIRSRRSQAEMRSAYRTAAALVAELDRRWGRAEVMRWLRNGVPGSVLSRSGQPLPHEEVPARQ